MRKIKQLIMTFRIKQAIKNIKHYASDGVTYDPDTGIHTWRWTDSLEDKLWKR